MEIRAARAGDAAALAAVFADWDHALAPDAITERLREWESTPPAEVLVAAVDGGWSASPRSPPARISRGPAGSRG